MITASARTFFDPTSVLGPAQKAEQQTLTRAGAFIRTAARSMIRTRKGVSAPDEPPSSHVGTLRNLILFDFDPTTFTEVIGAVFGGSNRGAPKLLEHGGEVEPRRRRVRLLRYRARPFMGPALAKELPDLPELWRGSVH